MITLQCCIVFCYTSHESATGVHRSPPSWTPFSPPTPPHHARWSQSTELTSLSHTVHSHLLSALHMVMCMLPYYSLNSSLPLLPSLCPQVCALCLHLHCACVPSHFSHVQLFVSLWPVAHQAPLFLGIPRQEHWSGLPCPPPGDLPNPGIEPRPPALQADYLPAEPPRKPKNTRVGSLSFLQGIFPTRELNQGIQQCRWILYQLSYLGSPISAHSAQTMLPISQS